MRPERLLRRLTASIVSACDPEQIVLFGSYAKGQENRDSDLDILVIGNFRGSPFLRGQEIRELLHTCPIRVEILVATPEEVVAESMKPFGFLMSVLASGVTLYSKTKDPTKVG